MTVAALITGAMFTSCGDGKRNVYSEFEDIGSGGWDASRVIMFSPWPADSCPDATSRRYDIDLVLRYSSRKQAGVLPMAVSVEDDSGIIAADTIIAGNNSLRGEETRETYGIRQVSIPFRRGVQLSPGYSLSITPLFAADASAGLLNIGAVMRESGGE